MILIKDIIATISILALTYWFFRPVSADEWEMRNEEKR